jgi:hypothetical protein
MRSELRVGSPGQPTQRVEQFVGLARGTHSRPLCRGGVVHAPELLDRALSTAAIVDQQTSAWTPPPGERVSAMKSGSTGCPSGSSTTAPHAAALIAASTRRRTVTPSEGTAAFICWGSQHHQGLRQDARCASPCSHCVEEERCAHTPVAALRTHIAYPLRAGSITQRRGTETTQSAQGSSLGRSGPWL